MNIFGTGWRQEGHLPLKSHGMYFPTTPLLSPLSLLLSEDMWDGVKEDVWRVRVNGKLVMLSAHVEQK